MAKYRKKPVVIEAVQLTVDNWDEVCDFADVGITSREVFVHKDRNEWSHYYNHDYNRLGLQINTLEGEMVAIEGDYIIRGVQGELYPCKPDIFHLTYEPVDAQE